MDVLLCRSLWERELGGGGRDSPQWRGLLVTADWHSNAERRDWANPCLLGLRITTKSADKRRTVRYLSIP